MSVSIYIYTSCMELSRCSSACELAFTRYCNHQYCMVHGIQKEVGKRAYIAQRSCTSIVIR